MAVGPLPVTMIEPAFGASLMPQVGLKALPAPGVATARQAAIALSAVAVAAEPEYCVTFLPEANSLPKNYFAVIFHLPSRAGLDNGNDFVSG